MKANKRSVPLKALKARFEKKMKSRECIERAEVETRLVAPADALRTLGAMDALGGEPDVIGRDLSTGQFELASSMGID